MVDAHDQNPSISADDEFNVPITYPSSKKLISTDLSDNSCPACQNNDQPTGAHICFLCQKYVHSLPQCSLIFNDSEEGYGQRRICMMCKNVENIKI